jgi:hypothetical protein
MGKAIISYLGSRRFNCIDVWACASMPLLVLERQWWMAAGVFVVALVLSAVAERAAGEA